jgi:colanic acid/amylovoran biosynthesis glycosyltransferase
VSLSEYLGIMSQVTFHGERQNEHIRSAMLRDMDVLIVASHEVANGTREGLPMTLQEGCASGLACIGTRCGGIPELIVSEKTGLLVEEHDINGLATAMQRLASNPKLRRELGALAREFCADRFDCQRQFGEFAGLFETVANDREHEVPTTPRKPNIGKTLESTTP